MQCPSPAHPAPCQPAHFLTPTAAIRLTRNPPVKYKSLVFHSSALNLNVNEGMLPL